MLFKYETPEDYLRHHFGEVEILNDDTIYPNALQRPKIYAAMKEYAKHWVDVAASKSGKTYVAKIIALKTAIDNL